MKDAAGKTPTTAVVWIPPDTVWEPIQAIRRRYDRHLPRWMPHVTLLYPFRFRDRFDTIEPVFYEVCAKIKPFDVEMRELQSFQHSPHSFTMWLSPEPAAGFNALQAALQAAFPDCNDVSNYAGGYSPHLSLGQAHSPAELEERMKGVHEGWSPLKASVHEIALIARDGEGPFHVDKIIPLG